MESEVVSAIIPTDGGYMIGTGGYIDPNSTVIMLIRIDSLGNLLWSKKFPISGGKLGRTYNRKYFLTGMENSGSTSVPVLLKLDSSGMIEFSWNVGYTNGIGIHKAICTKDNGFLLTGVLHTPVPGTEIYVMKVDSIGNLSWYKCYDIDTTVTLPSTVVEDNDGYILAGRIYKTGYHIPFLMKIDSVGQPLQVVKMNNNTYYDIIDEVFFDSSNELIVSGRIDDNLFTIKMDPSLNFIDGKYYETVTPTYRDQFIIEDGIDHLLGGSYNSAHTILIRTDSTFTSGCLEYPFSKTWITQPIPDTIMLPLSLTPGLISVQSASLTKSPIPVSIITMCSTGINENSNSGSLHIYPNPATDKLYIDSDITEGGITIYNALGKEVHISSFKGNNFLDISLLKPGFYIVNIAGNQTSVSEKLIVK